ncbi:DUF4153 domain-containing protein [Acidaminobacter hydrogenoformans]|uniref:DUF4153 domain-containing protein n=1 Tax=Acidaminobacter hydrogenoformans DSM 2784 TaxID=1120920 RepID=A0A1G5S0I6_9FIRM|nr:DUF4153 domain-containing protein [Acidaminobacter hydrogenoformans]SCZ79657.1 protein of unknown function [Acidaminobacter hydrogenoformans DSM 2784]
MNKFKDFIRRRLWGLIAAAARFPVSVAGFVAAAVVVYSLIEGSGASELILQKWLFTLIVGSILGMALQFAMERFEKLAMRRALVYGVGLLLTAGYFLILLPVPEISETIGIRSAVAVFSMLCMVLWLPSFGKAADFNKVALTHVKTFATSWLYGAVLSAGIAAVIATVDALLFSVNDDAYAYAMTTVWIVFAPVYYLSLLPLFDHRQKQFLEEGFEGVPVSSDNAAVMPKFFEILISYIAVPLVAVYTAVLAAYCGKILMTQAWPSGQLGPMVLVYSAAGLAVFVLASLLDNGFARVYTKVFPKAWIPVVIMQLISVGIRLNAYGITESRYYVALFGVFSLVAALMLSFSPVSKNGRVALLAAVFALVSIVPPVDAFTVSRNSQIERLEVILTEEGMLADGALVAKATASQHTREETTSIVNYLSNSGSLSYVRWLPEDFKSYEDFTGTFGFERTYASDRSQRYAMVSLDPEAPLNVAGYDRMMAFHLFRHKEAREVLTRQVLMEGKAYNVVVTRTSSVDGQVALMSSGGEEMLTLQLYEAVEGFLPQMGADKPVMPPEALTIEAEGSGLKMAVVFESVSLFEMDQGERVADYGFYVLVGTGPQ